MIEKDTSAKVYFTSLWQFCTKKHGIWTQNTKTTNQKSLLTSYNNVTNIICCIFSAETSALEP